MRPTHQGATEQDLRCALRTVEIGVARLYPRPMSETGHETRRASGSGSLIVTPERIAAARVRITGKVHRTPILSSSTAGRVVVTKGLKQGDEIALRDPTEEKGQV